AQRASAGRPLESCAFSALWRPLPNRPTISGVHGTDALGLNFRRRCGVLRFFCLAGGLDGGLRPPAGKDTRGPFPVASQGTDLSSEGASRKRTSTAREGPRPGQPLHTALLLMLPLQGKEPHAPN